MKKFFVFILLICVIFSGCGKSDKTNNKIETNEKALGEPNMPFGDSQDVQSEVEVTTTEAVTTTVPNVTTTAPTVTTAPKVTEPVNNEKIIKNTESKFFNINDEIVFMHNDNTTRCFKLKIDEVKLDNNANYDFLKGYKTKIKMTVTYTPFQSYCTDVTQVLARTYSNIETINQYHIYKYKETKINTPNQYAIYFYCNTDNEFQVSFRGMKNFNFYINYKINPKSLNS